ncbi:MAG: ABC transporter ATP-binding protein [Gammaproteobacteria bacterium]|nr:ABC transporter ATP-binding protein [Gammaproteobacteria bacterium]
MNGGAAPRAEAAIETHSLRREFGRNVAVDDLSLSVGRGEVFGFLGPNGAGKTTSLKLLLGLVEPSAGSGRVLGAPLGEPRARARIGFLPEHFRFHDCLTARELLRVHGRLYGIRGAQLAARADVLLERVHLADAADRPLRTYSKGMLQRAGLAQALLNEPELVFLDEPTSGLDPLGRLLVRDIIKDLRDNGTAVFLNSHLLGEVEATCDRVAFVKRGRVLMDLPLRELRTQAACEAELKIDPLDSGTLEGLAAFACAVERLDGRVLVRVEGEHVLPEIARWLIGRGIALYEMRCRRKTLEEWFVEVMGEDQRPG